MVSERKKRSDGAALAEHRRVTANVSALAVGRRARSRLQLAAPDLAIGAGVGTGTPDPAIPPGLILSLYPGIDLLGRGFEAEGWAVVRGPDLIWGGDVRTFHVPRGRFDGVIAGSPCQDFSLARRSEATGYGIEMLRHFARVVVEAGAGWFLLENVPTVPSVIIPGYQIQRFDLNARECGSAQRRNRHFQFGSLAGWAVVPERTAASGVPAATCLATEGRKKERRTWADFCELQGLPRDFSLPGLSREASYRAVGNGVNVLVARTVARAIRAAVRDGVMLLDVSLCICGCGRRVQRKGQRAGNVSCRKRLQRRRERASAAHDFLELVTPDLVLPAESVPARVVEGGTPDLSMVDVTCPPWDSARSSSHAMAINAGSGEGVPE